VGQPQLEDISAKSCFEICYVYSYFEAKYEHFRIQVYVFICYHVATKTTNLTKNPPKLPNLANLQKKHFKKYFYVSNYASNSGCKQPRLVMNEK